MSEKKKTVWILDNGHGKDTLGKRSPVWENGSQLLEYRFNREIVTKVAKELKKLKIPYEVLVPEKYDVSLYERVKRVEKLKEKHENVIVISVHANAGGGTGWEAWTFKGESESDKVADAFYKTAEKAFPKEKMRKDMTDGDADKETDVFYILKKTPCPAVLTENFFMDNYKDCEKLFNPKFKDKIAKMHVNAIKAYGAETK